ASVFISRWDAAVRDKVPAKLRNQLGIAIASRTYKASRELLSATRLDRFFGAGGWPQRLLWASTGVKDPKASAVLYVTSLAAPFTVDTMPEATLKALAEETRVSSLMAADGGECEQLLADFAAAGIDIDALAEQLQDEGTKSFAKSWSSLMSVNAAKSTGVKGSTAGKNG